MSLANQTLLACPKCRHRFSAKIEQIIDVGVDPSAKMRLLSGQINNVTCPNCGFQMGLGMPVAYHDPGKELLLIHVPMELNMNQAEQEQIIGRLLRTITDNLSAERRKGYLLNPRRTFTMQGMIDSILQADGITKEMLEARRKKLTLVEKFMRTPPDDLPALAAQHDAELDEEFFSMLSTTAQAVAADGRNEVAEQVMRLSELILQHSSYGQQLMAELQTQEKALQKVSKDLAKLGQHVTRRQLIDLLLSYEDHDEYLQAFVGMARPALDYQFFAELTAYADEDKSKKVRVKARRVRDRLLELVQEVDAQSQVLVQQAGALLQEIVNSPNLEAGIRQYLPMMNNVFMAVLEANLQEAEKQKNQALLQRLQTVQRVISRLMMESSPPEIQFINELLRAKDTLEARLLLMDRAKEFGPPLLDYLNALIQQLTERGEPALVERLRGVLEEAEKILAE